MRIGIIGNSHLAALKLAHDSGDAVPVGVTVSFWGMPGGALTSRTSYDDAGRLSIDAAGHNALAALTGDRHAVFDPSQHDVVVIYGQMPTLEKYCLDLGRPFSSAVRADIDASVRARFPYRYGAVVRRNCERLIMVDRPMMSELAPSPSATAVAMIAESAKRLRGFAEEIGAIFVAQPERTLAGPLRTRKEYSVGVRDFNGSARPVWDHQHMNSAYGRIMLAEIVAACLGRVSKAA